MESNILNRGFWCNCKTSVSALDFTKTSSRGSHNKKGDLLQPWLRKASSYEYEIVNMTIAKVRRTTKHPTPLLVSNMTRSSYTFGEQSSQGGG